MTIELKAAISDRESLKKSHQVLGEEMEKVKAELSLTQAKYVLWDGVGEGIAVYIPWVCCPDW